ncbi:MAG: Hsp20/alpha crystallin family protein [Bacteroidetes bacterium]|nr:MAG: Hsp20/alpha crystallin family protein [Bacteroidota bacterium]
MSKRNLFDEVFNRSISDFVGTDFVLNMPSVNIEENDDGYTIQLAAPGLTKDEFKIDIEKDRLFVSAEKEQAEEVTEGKYTRKEFNYSSFKRSFFLPKSIDREAIEANYENGVLSVVLPKKAEVVIEEKGRTIEIR